MGCPSQTLAFLRKIDRSNLLWAQNSQIFWGNRRVVWAWKLCWCYGLDPKRLNRFFFKAFEAFVFSKMRWGKEDFCQRIIQRDQNCKFRQSEVGPTNFCISCYKNQLLVPMFLFGVDPLTSKHKEIEKFRILPFPAVWKNREALNIPVTNQQHWWGKTVRPCQFCIWTKIISILWWFMSWRCGFTPSPKECQGVGFNHLFCLLNLGVSWCKLRANRIFLKMGGESTNYPPEN